MADGLARNIASTILGIVMVYAGYLHFHSPEPFIKIMPSALPYKSELVSLSGFFEVLGGLGLIIPLTRRVAAAGLIALYITVFPANVNMAVHHIPIDGVHYPPPVLWLRLPFQLLFICWAYWCANFGKRAGVQHGKVAHALKS
jgi:uncharacterized membrane protein